MLVADRVDLDAQGVWVRELVTAIIAARQARRTHLDVIPSDAGDPDEWLLPITAVDGHDSIYNEFDRSQCGTVNGYARHTRWAKKRGVPTEPCVDCRAAHAADTADRERRKATGGTRRPGRPRRDRRWLGAS